MSEQFSANSILDHFTFATPFINGDIINGDDEIGEQQVKDVVLKVEVSSPSNQPITYSQIPNFLQRILNMNLNNKAAKDINIVLVQLKILKQEIPVLLK